MNDWDHTYGTKGITQNGVLPTVERSKNVMQENGCSTILDLGCGTGRHTIYLAKAGFTVYGADKSPNAIRILTNRLKDEKLRSVFLTVADMITLPYEDGKFDAVVCVWSTGHGYRRDVIKSMDEMCRVLKPSGILLADFPSKKDRNFGKGIQLEPNTFLHPFLDHPDVPHNYFEQDDLEVLLSERFLSHRTSEITYDDPKYKSFIEAFWVEAHHPKARTLSSSLEGSSYP